MRSRAKAPASGQGRAAARNERAGGNNARNVARGVNRHDWPLTPRGWVLLPDVAAARGVSRQAATEAAERHGLTLETERIPGRRGRPAAVLSPADADRLASVLG